MKRREFITLLGGSARGRLRRGQQPEPMRRIGVLTSGAAADDPDGRARSAVFLQSLQQLGWTDGRNIRVDYRWGVGDPDNMRKYAAELVALAPDVLVASGTASVSLLRATRTVPIVFAQVTDPVGAGFVDSLARLGATPAVYYRKVYVTDGGLSPMVLLPPTSTVAPPATSIAFSKARSPPNCRCRHRPSSNWLSTSRPPRRSASKCRRLLARADEVIE
jgi:hypothetical protein